MATIQDRKQEPGADEEMETSSSSSAAAITKNERHLDPLILDYLGLFDTYQEARTELSKALSSGFFNIAQANYGRQFLINQGDYDQRMQATTLVNYDSINHKFIIHNINDEEDDTRRSKDPIQWFGGFPSPSLRRAQSDFKQGFNEIISLINLIQNMQSLEDKIKGSPHSSAMSK